MVCSIKAKLLSLSAEEILQLISANDKLRVCFDSNHLLMDDNLNFLKKLSGKIVTVHISDYDFVKERHFLPKEGKIDWMKVIGALKAVNYQGVFNYEVLDRYTPEQVKQSYIELFDEFNRG